MPTRALAYGIPVFLLKIESPLPAPQIILTPHIHLVDVIDHMLNKERDTLLWRSVKWLRLMERAHAVT